MGGIKINAEQSRLLTGHFADLAEAIGQIAQGAYVTDTMFIDTCASSAQALDGTLHQLVSVTGYMQRCSAALAKLLDEALDGFEATDLAQADHVNRARRVPR